MRTTKNTVDKTQESVESKLTDKEEKKDKDWEIQLEDNYEDKDFRIYFDKIGLLNYIDSIEDDNLFKIKLIEQEEQHLETLLKAKAESETNLVNSIKNVEANIIGLNKTKINL